MIERHAPILRSMALSEKTTKRQIYSSEFKAEAAAKHLNILVNATSKEPGITPVTLRDSAQRSEGCPLQLATVSD